MGTVDKQRLANHLALAILRLHQYHHRVTASAPATRSRIAASLHTDHLDTARVHTRQAIHDDYLCEAIQHTISFCRDLQRGASLVCRGEMDDGLVTAVHSIVYAAHRMGNVPELLAVVDDLARLVGSRLVEEARANVRLKVDQRLAIKLALEVPDDRLVDQYLGAIADSHGIPWHSPAPNGFSDIYKRFEDLKRNK